MASQKQKSLIVMEVISFFYLVLMALSFVWSSIPNTRLSSVITLNNTKLRLFGIVKAQYDIIINPVLPDNKVYKAYKKDLV